MKFKGGNPRTSVIGTRVIVESGETEFEDVAIQSTEPTNVLHINGGTARLTNVRVGYGGVTLQEQDRRDFNAALYVQSGSLTMVGGNVGPGYSQSAANSGGTMTLHNVEIYSGLGYALVARAGTSTVASSHIIGLGGIYIHGGAAASLYRNRFSVRATDYVVQAYGQARIRVEQNTFDNRSDGDWLCLVRGVIYEVKNNSRTNGQKFAQARWCQK